VLGWLSSTIALVFQLKAKMLPGLTAFRGTKEDDLGLGCPKEELFLNAWVWKSRIISGENCQDNSGGQDAVQTCGPRSTPCLFTRRLQPTSFGLNYEESPRGSQRMMTSEIPVCACLLSLLSLASSPSWSYPSYPSLKTFGVYSHHVENTLTIP
jgi:hypothetical protein